MENLPNLIIPSINDNSFTTHSGKQYVVHSTIGTKRFEILEKIQVELQHGVSLSGFVEEVSVSYDLLNKSKPADAAVRLNNLLNGASRILAGVPHPVLMICSLFICSPDEDLRKWSEAEQIEKIHDWEGVSMDFFLASAKRFVLRYSTGLDSGFLNFSEMLKKEDAEITALGKKKKN